MIINLHILYGISIAYKANNDVVEENVVKKDTDIYIEQGLDDNVTYKN